MHGVMFFLFRVRVSHPRVAVVKTRVASHLARSDTPSITCIVDRLHPNTPPTNGKAQREPLASTRRPVAGLSRKVSFHEIFP